MPIFYDPVLMKYSVHRIFIVLLFFILSGCLSLPSIEKIDVPSDQEVLPLFPGYDDPIWIMKQGLPLKSQWLKEGRSVIPEGEMFVIPFVLSKLPYKNLQETREWVKHVNQHRSPSSQWKYNSRRRMGHYKCMSVSASTVLDWFALKQGKALNTYQSILNGKEEKGFNHRAIDAIYYKWSGTPEKEKDFPLLNLRKDPIEQTPVSYRMKGFAEIITSAHRLPQDEEIVASDPSLRKVTHRIKVKEFLDFPYHVLFGYTPSFQVAREPGPYNRLLVEALEKYGPVYAGLRVRFATSGGVISATDAARLAIPAMSGHGVVLVGYIRQQGRTYFIYRETFGDYNAEGSEGGPAYRLYPVHSINEAYSFHP